MSENNLTHFDAAGNAVMVDVSAKPVTTREATAHGIITMNAEAFAAVQSGTVKKGDVLGVARIAGIMATKRTSELIPLCHPLPLTKVGIEFRLLPERQAVEALCTVKTSGVTGVEMEALTGVSTALLTIYDTVAWLRTAGYDPGKVHIQSSYGLWNLPAQPCDYVRAGIALYGVHLCIALGLLQAHTTFGCVVPPPSIFHCPKENQSLKQGRSWLPS